MRCLTIVLTLCAALFAAGCAPGAHYAASPEIRTNEPYTLASGDRLRVIVFGQDALSNYYSVDGSGHISMPLIGLVPAHGLTTVALERAIENRLRNGFLREPRVAVEVEAYRPFFVLGEVAAAGQYPYINGMTVQNAIAVAGGFTPRGYRWSAELTRVVDGRTITASVPITQTVRPGDTIVVRERLF